MKRVAAVVFLLFATMATIGWLIWRRWGENLGPPRRKLVWNAALSGEEGSAR